MKNILLSALVLFGTVSCVKDQFDESLGERVTITLTAENPGFGDTKTKASSADSSVMEGRIVYEDSSLFICAPQSMEPSTKTGMTTDGIPFWAAGDKISFVTKSTNGYVNNEFTSNQTDSLVKATTFSGSVLPSGYTDAFAFYPYNKDAVITSTDVTLTIPSNQTPKYASSFDGKADILVSQKLSAPSTTDLDGSQLQFSRKVGFLKIGLYDEKHNALGVKIISLSVTTPDNINLVGACQLNLKDGKLSAPSVNNNSVTVKYPDEGTSTVFLSIYPQTIIKDTKLTFHCETVDSQQVRKTYNITKKIGANISVKANEYTFLGLIPAESNEVENISKNNAWLNFIESNAAMDKAREKGDMSEYNRILSERILLDYSYAGYKHGTAVPPTIDELKTANWTEFNVSKYCKDENGNKCSDRDAFLRALDDAGIQYKIGDKIGNTAAAKKNPKAIIYFPKRTKSDGTVDPYVLHDRNDDTLDEGWEGKPKSNQILILSGDFIMAGDNCEYSQIEMADVNYPTSGAKYSSPEMILVKHPSVNAIPTAIATVTEDAVRGSDYIITDKAVSGWVILCLDASPSQQKDILAFEFGGHEPVNNTIHKPTDDTMADIKKNVIVRDFHQVKSCELNPAGTGYKVTFMEPVMREINLARDGADNWFLATYNCYENVGVENLTFVGHAKEKFQHHASWKDDGGYKPLTFTGLVNSWIRNVKFKSITECVSLKQCANCSAYEIEISGNRGHAGLRSAGSSRIFLGNIYDHSKGYPNVNQKIPNGAKIEDAAGQYHASGVSKPSMGAVLWRNRWGTDATFESHSGQPRATLVDHCKGGWVEKRFGGDRTDIPNHLGDLCIWNMEATIYKSPTFKDKGNSFQFWFNPNTELLLWRVTPPIVVGFHGTANVDFDTSVSAPGKPGQMKYKESMGQKVATESLYEAQLQERINREGIPSAWLYYLKGHTPTFR